MVARTINKVLQEIIVLTETAANNVTCVCWLPEAWWVPENVWLETLSPEDKVIGTAAHETADKTQCYCQAIRRWLT